jgi:hypothetical protein
MIFNSRNLQMFLNFLVFPSQSFFFTYFLSVLKMDPPLIFVEIKSILKNGKNYPNLLITEGNREFILQRKTTLANSLRYMCIGRDSRNRPCSSSYEVTINDRILVRKAYHRVRKLPDGTTRRTMEHKITLTKNEELLNTLNYTIKGESGSHSCLEISTVQERMRTSLKNFLATNIYR